MKCPARHAIRGSLVARCDLTRPHKTHFDRRLDHRWTHTSPVAVVLPARPIVPEPERPCCDACLRPADGTMVSFEVAGEPRATFHHRCAPVDLAFEDFLLRAQYLPDAPSVSGGADDAAPSDTSGPVPDGATSEDPS